MSYVEDRIAIVPNFDAPSRCSGPVTPTFRWYGYPQCEVGHDVNVAVAVLVDAISPAGRLWNPWSIQMAKSEFKQRILRAQRGELRPVDEVKPVDVANPPPLYEIRWQGIPVTDQLPDGSRRHGEVLVRMYHSEPAEAPSHFIGHHAHEKDVAVEDVNAAQQQEIRTAIGWHNQGQPSRWGLP
ncbi:hypothetical protein [Agromyces marinus]|uniref:hypothetical protein n=1 Tax=Agromyces marinus TaxID=1389020 RepID=UPI0025733B65|nr:hypothetical protein [Agromyces marinus]